MALNFAGLGFIFGAKDQGATRVAGRTAKSMDFLNNVFQRLDVTARASKFNAVINSWSATKIDELTDKMGALGNQMGSMPSMTSIEQEMFDIRKQLKSVGAQAGWTTKQFNDSVRAAGGMVNALNVSTDFASNVLKRFGGENKKYLKAISDGKKPLHDAARVAELFGGNVDDLYRSIKVYSSYQKTEFGTSIDVSAKKFKKMADITAHYSRELGDNGSMIKAFPEIIKEVSEANAKLPNSFRMSQDKLDKFTMSLVKSVPFFKALGKEGDQAKQAAIELGKSLIKPREEVVKLFTGEGGLDTLKTILPAAGKNADQIMDMLTNNTDKAMMILRKMVQEGGILAFEKIKEAYGEDFAVMLKSNDKAWDEVMQKMGKAADSVGEKAGGALADLAKKSHSAARTFDEVMSRMEDSYELQMRQLSGLKKSDILDIHRRKYNRILDITSTLTAGDGPISKLTGFFIRWKQAGAHAALGAIGGELLEIGEAAIPAATMMGSLGFRFSDVGRYAKVPLAPLAILNKMFLGMPGIITKFGGIIGAVTIGISLLGKKLQGTAKIGKSWHENMADEIFNISKKFLSFVPWIEGNLKDMKPWERVGFILKTGMDLAWDWVVENFKFGKKTIANIINKLADGINSIDWGKWSRKITEFITGSIVNVMDGIGAFFKALFSGEIIKGIEKSKSPIGEAISNFFIAVGRAIRDSVRGIWDSFVDWWEDDTKSAGDKIKEGGKFIGGLALAGMIAVPGFRQAGFGLMGKFLGGVEAAGGGLFSVFNKMFLGLPGILLKVLGPPALIIGGIGILGHAFEKMGIKSFEGFTDSFGYMFKTKLPNLIYDTAIKYLPKSISDSMISVANKAKSEGSGIWGQLGAVLVAGAKYAFEKFLDISEIITNKLANIDFNEVSNKIGNFFTSVITGLSSFISGAVSGLFTDGFDKSTELTLGQRFGVAIKNGFFVALDFVKAAIVGIADSIASTFSRIWSDKSTGLGEKLVSSLFTGAAVIGGIGLLLKIFKKKFVSGAKEMAICPKFECNDKRGLFRRTFGKKHDERVPFCPKFECGDSRGWFRRTFGKKHDERIEFCPKLECSKDVKKGFFSRRKKQMQGVGFCPVNEKCISSTIERGVSRAGKKIKKRGLFGRIRDRFRKTPEYGMKELGRGSLWQRAKGKFRGEIELEGDSFKKPESRFKRMMKRLRGEPKLKLIDINKVTKKLNKTEGLFSRFKKRVGSKFKRGPQLMGIGEFTGVDKPRSRIGRFADKAKGLGGRVLEKGKGVGGKVAGVMGKSAVLAGRAIAGAAGMGAMAFTTLAYAIPTEKVEEFRKKAIEVGGATGFMQEKAASLMLAYQNLDAGTQTLIQTGSMFASSFVPGMLGGLKKIGGYLGPKFLPMLSKGASALKGWAVPVASLVGTTLKGWFLSAAAGASAALPALGAVAVALAPVVAILAAIAAGGAAGYVIDKIFNISGRVSDKLVEGQKEAQKNMSKMGEQQAYVAKLREQTQKYIDMHRSGMKNITVDGKQVALTQEFVMKRITNMGERLKLSKDTIGGMRNDLVGMLKAGGIESDNTFNKVANKITETTTIASEGINNFTNSAKEKITSIPKSYANEMNIGLENSVVALQEHRDGPLATTTNDLYLAYYNISSGHPEKLKEDLNTAGHIMSDYVSKSQQELNKIHDFFRPPKDYKKSVEKASKSIAKINKKTTDDVSGNVLFKKISGIMSSYEAGEITAATAFKVLGRHSNIIKQIKDIYGKDGAKLMLKVKKFTESYISESAKIGSTKGGKKLEERYLKLKEQYESIKGFTKKDIDKRKKIYSSIMKLENIMEKKSLKNKKGAANNVLRFEKDLGIKRAKARNTGGGGGGVSADLDKCKGDLSKCKKDGGKQKTRTLGNIDEDIKNQQKKIDRLKGIIRDEGWKKGTRRRSEIDAQLNIERKSLSSLEGERALKVRKDIPSELEIIKQEDKLAKISKGKAKPRTSTISKAKPKIDTSSGGVLESLGMSAPKVKTEYKTVRPDIAKSRTSTVSELSEKLGVDAQTIVNLLSTLVSEFRTVGKNMGQRVEFSIDRDKLLRITKRELSKQSPGGRLGG